MLQQEAKRLHQEQKESDSMSKKLDRVRFSSAVKLNIGGKYFTTSVQTLTKDPNSMLAAMFSGRFEVKPSEDGSFFIDRDGTHFRFILNYLRDGELILPEDDTFLRQLKAEAKFYQLQGILYELKPKLLFAESVILWNKEHRRVLVDWLPASLVGEWRLLFRASRDGFEATVFHSYCDNKGPTITVVKSGGNIFGGFTEKSWTSQGVWVTCNQAFLFSMVNPSGLVPTIMPLVTGRQQNAIYCNISCGPTFGGGYFGDGRELQISYDACTTSFLGHTYQLPPGQQNTFFTGGTNCTVTDYEVFGLHQ